jgi:hypothetical protein
VSAPPALYLDTNSAPSSAFDLTGTWYLQITVTCSINGATLPQQSIVTQRLLYAEVR